MFRRKRRGVPSRHVFLCPAARILWVTWKEARSLPVRCLFIYSKGFSCSKTLLKKTKFFKGEIWNKLIPNCFWGEFWKYNREGQMLVLKSMNSFSTNTALTWPSWWHLLYLQWPSLSKSPTSPSSSQEEQQSGLLAKLKGTPVPLNSTSENEH